MVNNKKKKLTKAEKIKQAQAIIDSADLEAIKDKARMNKARAVHYSDADVGYCWSRPLTRNGMIDSSS